MRPKNTSSPVNCLESRASMGSEESNSDPTLVSSLASSVQSLGFDAHNDVAAFAGLQLTCFTELVDDVTLYFLIIRLPEQIYAWIGCNSARLGHWYAAAPTRPSNSVSATSILGGASDNTGFRIARRLVLKTGLSLILACNIPNNSPMLEASAEKKLIEKLISLCYTTPKPRGLSS